MKILSVVGARPNFVKIAPFVRAIQKYNLLNPLDNIDHVLVHTGQHYSDRLSYRFMQELNLPQPDINLSIGSGSHAEQLGKTMIAFEKTLQVVQPDWVVVVGDVNAVLSCSVVARKDNYKICHIEAGLRSGDYTMPEEVNRIIADRMSDLLLTHDRISIENLKKEGIPETHIRFVGNIMIDTLEEIRAKASRLDRCAVVKNNVYHQRKSDKDTFPLIQTGEFVLMTLHRPSNVEHPETLKSLVRLISEEICKEMVVVWTVHPRTEKNLKESGLWKILEEQKNLLLVKPIMYSEMLCLNMSARAMLTDSGGLQEECTVLGTPCLVLRNNTERPVTLLECGGTCILASNQTENIRESFKYVLSLKRTPSRPERWDGHTAERCIKSILDYPSDI